MIESLYDLIKDKKDSFIMGNSSRFKSFEDLYNKNQVTSLNDFKGFKIVLEKDDSIFDAMIGGYDPERSIAIILSNKYLPKIYLDKTNF